MLRQKALGAVELTASVDRGCVDKLAHPSFSPRIYGDLFMKIAIYGLGYVGLTAAACLTSEGHSVVGVDVSEIKVRETNAGKSPIKEPGLEELLSKAV